MRGKQLNFFGSPEDKGGISRRYVVAFPLDTIVLLSIVIILLITISFSLGVEKGRKLAFMQRKEGEEAKAPENLSKQPVRRELPSKRIDRKEGGKSPAKEKSENEYLVQVASYLEENAANKEADRLKGKGYPALVLRKGRYVAVYVGEFADKSTARKSMKALEAEYGNCLLRTVKK